MNNLSYFVRAYYGRDHIREMIWKQFENTDFCIGSNPTLIRRGWTFPVKVLPKNSLGELIAEGMDLFRPLRPSNDKYLYIIWDLEYFNTDSCKYLYDGFGSHQKMIFDWMEPVILLIAEILNGYGIKYVIDTTASGYHVWSRISTDSPAFREFAKEGHLEDSLREKYDLVIKGDIKRQRPIPLDLGRAYNTAGKMLEYITHLLIAKARENKIGIPITVSDTNQGGADFPRSGISSDLTQYAHPLFMRTIRIIGSMHQKVRLHFPAAMPAVDIMRIPGMTIHEILDTMWDVNRAALFYKGKDITVPFSNEGWLKALTEYRKSSLRKWHQEFEVMPVSEEIKTHASEHPPCIQQNVFWQDAHICLLKPTNLQHIAEYYTSIGENIKRVALAIARKYAKPEYRWYDPVAMTGIDWTKYDPYTAANFWMRVYSGLYRAGLGRGLDCEKLLSSKVCPVSACGRVLTETKSSVPA